EKLNEIVANMDGLGAPNKYPCQTQLLEYYGKSSWLPLLQKPDPEIFCPAEFLRQMQPLVDYLKHVTQTPADKRSEVCKADPAAYYAYDKRENMLKEAKAAMETFAEFYSDVLNPSESKPVDVKAGH